MEKALIREKTTYIYNTSEAIYISSNTEINTNININYHKTKIKAIKFTNINRNNSLLLKLTILILFLSIITSSSNLNRNINKYVKNDQNYMNNNTSELSITYYNIPKGYNYNEKESPIYTVRQLQYYDEIDSSSFSWTYYGVILLLEIVNIAVLVFYCYRGTIYNNDYCCIILAYIFIPLFAWVYVVIYYKYCSPRVINGRVAVQTVTIQNNNADINNNNYVNPNKNIAFSQQHPRNYHNNPYQNNYPISNNTNNRDIELHENTLNINSNYNNDGGIHVVRNNINNNRNNSNAPLNNNYIDNRRNSNISKDIVKAPGE